MTAWSRRRDPGRGAGNGGGRAEADKVPGRRRPGCDVPLAALASAATMGMPRWRQLDGGGGKLAGARRGYLIGGGSAAVEAHAT